VDHKVSLECLEVMVHVVMSVHLVEMECLVHQDFQEQRAIEVFKD
jgi:hypothetical protein